MGRVPRVLVKCSNCEKEIEVKEKEYISRTTFFCCTSCVYEYRRGKTFEELYGEEKATQMKNRLSEVARGDKNPNYNNRWSDEQRAAASIQLKNRYIDNDELRQKVGSANRNKIFSEERRKNMSLAKKGKPKPPMTEDTKKLIGLKSAEKFTPEFKERMKETMRSKGYWLYEYQKPPYKLYMEQANWIAGMWDFIEDSYQKYLLNTYGVFNAWNNINGVCRDHIISRKYGFDNNIPPILLRHPANCQIILHSKNVQKGSANHKTLEELLVDIILYSGKEWSEQLECIKTIKEKYYEYI